MPTVLITGGHGGIGLECSKHLAAHYRTNLLLAGRSLERVEPVARELAKTYGVAVNTPTLDTSSLASVRTAAAKCRVLLDDGTVDSLQAIVCNAGVRLGGRVTYSADGYEETFATNCLGHFLLVELLVDRLDSHGRIVYTASGTHDPDTVDGRMVGAAAEPDAIALANDGKDGKKPLPSGVRYSSSKLCNILYAYELHRRLRRSGSAVAALAFDPGSTPSTGFLRSMPKPVQWLSKSALMPWIMRRIGVTIGSPEFSGAGLARVALDSAYADGSGKYFQSNDGQLIETRSSRMSYDEQRARKLWNDSKKLTGLMIEDESSLLEDKTRLRLGNAALFKRVRIPPR
jgi:NAD(P)-dependent dehydrogenase (short-subunit alcohol dehydrogenase family)